MRITGKTQLVGVIGYPVSHTLSPAMHNAAIAELGLDWVYAPFPVAPDRLPEAVRGLQAVGARGFNATIPHKESLLPLLDEVSGEAAFIGAVNTVLFHEDGRSIGYNTDAEGFLRAMDESGIAPPEGEKAAVMGAGGAARAVAAALAKAKAREIVIVNRTFEKAEALAAEADAAIGVSARAEPLTEAGIASALDGTALLVNATSAGMDGSAGLPIDADALRPPLAVYDIVYSPPQTGLLKTAAQNGCKTLNGLGMLTHQGAIALERWTGLKAPVETMRQALLAAQ